MATPRSVQPLSVSLAMGHIAEAIDILSEQAAGYKVSQRVNLATAITRLSSILRSNPRNRKARKELHECLNEYEQKYGFFL